MEERREETDVRQADLIIVGGGPCAYNAEPLCDFCDAFSIGEGEEALPEMVALYQKMKKEQNQF